MQFAWHYTNADNLPSIRRLGLLPREGSDLIWFSTNQRWEPLAETTLGPCGSDKAARLGLRGTDSRLMTLDQAFGHPLLQDLATSRMWMMIEITAKSLGSDPMLEWRVAPVRGIPFYDLRVQRVQRGVWADE